MNPSLLSLLSFLFLPACSASPEALSLRTLSVEEETLLLQSPTVSDRHVVFVYADDLWIVGREGGDARRLTSHEGREMNPRLSPDGTRVAFTGQYEGNLDVYVMDVDGGVPTRLTWHPGPDVVTDWHPDGRRIAFRSMRTSATRDWHLYLVDAEGAMPEKHRIPKAYHAAFEPGGTGRIAYTPFADAFRSWKRYRGGRTPSIWILDQETLEVEVVPHVNASDTFPVWLGGALYFASDRDGDMNLWRYAPGSDEVTQLTDFDDYDVRSLDSGGGLLAFEQGGAIHLLDPETGERSRLSIRCRADGLYARARWQDVGDAVRSASLAPNGKRAVFEARGEIVTVPREHGDMRNLSSSPGVNDRSPVWSPDGTKIAWLSDEGGEYRLVVRDRLGREEPKAYDLGPGGFFYDPKWSPDGEHVLFSDKTNRLAYLTLESGEVTDVASVQGSLGTVQPYAVWSPDSKWIAFEDRNPETLYDHISLFSLETGAATPVTDAFGASGAPAFSPDGKLMYFFATVEVGPNLFGLDMNTSSVRPYEGNLYVAVLQADGENPLAPRNDEGVDEEADEEDGKEKGKEKDKDEEDPDDGEEDADGEAEKEEEAGPPIDLAGIDQRILALPVPEGRYRSLACTKEKLLFLAGGDGGSELRSYDPEERKVETVLEGVQGFDLSADGKSLLVAKGPGSYSITDTSGKDENKLGIEKFKLRVVPREEWPQILREVWRIQRDYFYDENMHGVDWPAMWERYARFLPYVQHRSDLNLLVAELIGELACGHQYVSGGELPEVDDGVSVGLLGADWEVDGDRYRLARIYEGQNWNPGLRAPLTEPGVDAAVGDYLIAVNGRPVTTAENLYSYFEDTAGKQVDLTLSASASGADPRTTSVVPVASDSSLRRLSWVEDNRRRVDELSGGRLAYVYMPNTGGQGRNAFDRDFYSQIDKEGLVLDERYNGGGQVADYVIDVLSRDVMSYWMNREKWVGRSPFGMIDGPKVMIINESAGSGGDWMPWTFQRRGVGPLVGTRTWGGLVGISGYPPLMDGGSVTSANFGVMDENGEWAVENVGVSPDYEVVEWPREVLAGRDPQLDKAVELALAALEQREPKPTPVYHPPTVR